ncbi:MAG: DMT family transporter [Kofleriaceae bacterium]
MIVSRGVLYMIVSALGFSTMSLLVKLASARLPTGEIVLARAAITLALSYAMVRRAGIDPWGAQRGRLVMRGVLGFGGLSGYYLALALLPLADATTLHHTTPLLTTLLAWRVLGEPIGRATAGALVGGLAGVWLIAHPSGAGLAPAGVAVALGSAMCSATAYVTVRTLVRTEHPLVIVFYFPLVATPLAIPWAAASWVTPQPLDLVLLVGIGISTQVGQVFLTKGLAVERAGRASSVGYLQIVFAMAWQLVIFGLAPTESTLIGAALIIAGTLVVAAASDAPRTPAPTRSPPPR